MLEKNQKELLYQALETEIGGIEIYEKALECAQNAELRKEWKEYLQQTHSHVRILQEVFKRVGLDTYTETHGRGIVRHIGDALIAAMDRGLASGDPATAEIVACECVVLAEMKDHLNWELIGQLAEDLEGDEAKALRSAHEEVEEEEDEHLYHTQGWCRELWIKSMNLAAVLPPPEEKKDVKTAIGAARAKKARKRMVPRRRKGKALAQRA